MWVTLFSGVRSTVSHADIIRFALSGSIVGISVFLWEFKLSPWVGVQFKLGTTASCHWQYIKSCTVAVVGTTRVQRQSWKAYSISLAKEKF
jgi:hypothetical protein